MNRTEQWLESVGLSELLGIFRENDIDLDIVDALSEADMRELGLSLGQRKRLVRAIRSRSEDRPPTSLPEGASVAEKNLAERRQVTVLFIDLVGSTELSARHDPEEYQDILRVYQRSCTKIIERHGGTVAKYMGDGILVYFGYPRVDENSVERALRAGLAVISAATTLRPFPGARLSVRIGGATGLAIIGDLIGKGAAMEHQVVGDTPNLAARLQNLADANTMVISQASRELVGGFFYCEELPAQTLKGFADPVVAYRVVGETEVENRFRARSGQRRMSPLQGRDAEMARLVALWQNSVAGDGRAALIFGEPGSGKSRLLAELEDATADGTRFVLHMPCLLGFSGSVMYPIVTMLRRRAGIRPSDDPSVSFDKLRDMLTSLGFQSDDKFALAAAVLGIPPDGVYPPPMETPAQQRRSFLGIFRRILLMMGRGAPVLFCVEDLHWADPTTVEFLNELASAVSGSRLMLVFTSRTESELPMEGNPAVIRFDLEPISTYGLEEIILDTCNGRELPADVLAQVIKRADGNPLYAEEITKALLHSGRLRDVGNRLVPDGALTDIGVPSSLHDSLMTRLDDLPDARETAQVAAAIGREFELGMLAEIAGRSEEDVLLDVGDLEAAEIVYRRAEAHRPIFYFKHALLQDAAYESTLKRRRAQLHARIAGLLETRAASEGGLQPELMAHHLSRAGEFQRAVQFGQQASFSALSRSANAEAIQHAQACLDWVKRMAPDTDRDSTELSVHALLAPALMASRGYAAEEVEETAQRALELLDQLGDRMEAYPNLMGLAIYHHVRSERREAREMIQRFLSVAERMGHTDQVVAGLPVLGHCQWIDGDLDESIRTMLRVIDLYDVEKHATLAVSYGFDPIYFARTCLGQIYWCQGRATAAREQAEMALEHSRAIGHANSIGQCMLFVLNSAQERGEREMVREFGAEMLAYCDRMGLPTSRSYGQIVRNWGLGTYEDSVAMFQIHDAVGALLGMTYYRCIAAETALETGHPQDARDILAPAGKLIETGELFWEPAVLRMNALVDRALGADVPDVRAMLRTACSRARTLGTPIFEALSLIDLVELPPDERTSGEVERLSVLVSEEKLELPVGALSEETASRLSSAVPARVAENQGSIV